MKFYDTIIFDLDGTAIANEPNAIPTKTLINAVKTFRSKVNLCAATGRSLTNAQYIFKALNLTAPCIISAGTQIVDPRTKKIIWEVPMDLNDSRKVLEACRPYPYKVLLGDEVIEIGKTAREIQLTEQINVMYVMEVVEKDIEPLMEKFNNIKGITASKASSWIRFRTDIHITNKRATKEHSVKQLLKLLNTTREKSIGIGDGDNDIHLFKAVGLKIAMGNATKNLKEKADIIAEDVKDDGLAKVIEQYSQNKLG